MSESFDPGFVVNSGRMSSLGSSGAVFIGHDSPRAEEVAQYRSTPVRHQGEPTDIDALIANTRKHAKDYGWYPSRQECIDLADALEAEHNRTGEWRRLIAQMRAEAPQSQGDDSLAMRTLRLVDEMYASQRVGRADYLALYRMIGDLGFTTVLPPVPAPPHPEPQGEPSDAQVKAALKAYWGIEDDLSYPGTQMRDMRAALRAAGGVR